MIPQEAVIGILYGMAMVVSLLLADKMREGGASLSATLVGSMLWVSWPLVWVTIGIYAALGLLHIVCRRPILRLTENPSAWPRRAAWDFLFFVTQGIITILIVPVAGVLLAYGFLMIPAAIGTMFSRRWVSALLIGWGTGFAACVLGVMGSYRMDSPYGPTLMLAMGAAFSGRNATVVAASLEHMTLLYEMNEQLKDYLVNFTNEFISLNQTSMGKVTDRGYSSVENFIDVFVDDTYLNIAGNLTKVNSTVGTVRLGYLLGDFHQFARVVASNVTMWDDTVFAGKSMFAQWGVNIDSPSPYANGAFVMEAFANDAIDMGYLGSPPAIVRHLNVNTDNSDIRIVAQVNVEGSAIIVNADIQSIEDLGGKTLGTPGPGSIQHLMLLAFAQEHGFKVKLAGT